MSIVVPVYNPGPYIHPCADSVLTQSLDPTEYEAVFVDDGSTDGTGDWLDELAAAHANVRVVHTTNSGWSGRPRNVGIDEARGEYVQFLDQDDLLAEQALERMYEYGAANGADIVIGKIVGRGRGVPRELFARNLPHASLADAPLIDSLTPHKMFRRGFLDAHRLRFPEGRRRLEDHVFVTEAYFLAAGIAVLSDYACYYHVRRGDAGNAAYRPTDPVGYFANLREALDIVMRYTEPGPLRDRLLRRWLRVEMLGRLDGARLLAMPADQRHAWLREIQQVMRAYMGERVVAALPVAQRVRARLAADGRLDDLVRLAEWSKDVKATARLESLRWDGVVLRGALACWPTHGGEPLRFEWRGDRTCLDSATILGSLGAEVCDASDDLSAMRATVVLRERHTGDEFAVPASVEACVERVGNAPAGGEYVVVRLAGELVVDPLTAAAGARLRRGTWDVFVRLRVAGWAPTCRVTMPRAVDDGWHAGPALLGEQSLIAIPHLAGRARNLSIDVDESDRSLVDAAAWHPEAAGVRTRWNGAALTVPLDLVSTPGVPAMPAQLLLTPSDGGEPGTILDATLATVSSDQAAVTARLGLGVLVRTALHTGRYDVAVRIGDSDGRAVPVGLSLVARRCAVPHLVTPAAGRGRTRRAPAPRLRRIARRIPLLRRAVRMARRRMRLRAAAADGGPRARRQRKA